MSWPILLNLLITSFDKECFSNCTQLCKPHESNKMFWYIYDSYNQLDTDEDRVIFKNKAIEKSKEITKNIKYPEFIWKLQM